MYAVYGHPRAGRVRAKRLSPGNRTQKNNKKKRFYKEIYIEV